MSCGKERRKVEVEVEGVGGVEVVEVVAVVEC